MADTAHVRSYRPGDHEALADICVRTADNGDDSRHLYPDPGLMPALFAEPYAHLEPELTFVLDDGSGRAVDEGRHRPERMILPELVAYPAHLHIDLLPSYQRKGYGRELMGAFLGALHARGVPAVHLSMLTANTPARAFYDRLGFEVIDVPDPGPLTYLGRSTGGVEATGWAGSERRARARAEAAGSEG